MNSEKIQKEFFSFSKGLLRMRFSWNYLSFILFLIAFGCLMDGEYNACVASFVVAIVLGIIGYCKNKQANAESKYHRLLWQHKHKILEQIEYLRQVIIENVGCEKGEKKNTQFLEKNIKNVLSYCPSEIKDELIDYAAEKLREPLEYKKGKNSQKMVKLVNARFEELADWSTGLKSL